MISCLQLGTFGTDLDSSVMVRLFQRPIATLRVHQDVDKKTITSQSLADPLALAEDAGSVGLQQLEVWASKSPLM